MAVFHQNSTREYIVDGSGIARYTKVKSVQDKMGGDTINVKVHVFEGLHNVPRREESTRGCRNICKKGMKLYVIGCPTGVYDENTYVMYTDTYGIAKHTKFCNAIERDGVRCLKYIGTEVKEFNSSKVGMVDSGPAYMIELNRRHFWITEKWLSSDLYNKVYADNDDNDDNDNNDNENNNNNNNGILPTQDFSMVKADNINYQQVSQQVGAYHNMAADLVNSSINNPTAQLDILTNICYYLPNLPQELQSL